MIDKMANEAFMEYSMEVIKQRALPAVEDGCKPIHRRILFGMKDGGYTSNKPTRKSAKVVGEILGRFHPHGDSSVYDALTRLSQPWKMRYPLVEMQGNNGTILGDKQAAQRYTECRLTPLGELMTKDIDKNAVPMELNYSGEEYEPSILPSEFPNSLVNPNLGIAIGMSSTTMPHNLREVCDAIVAYMRSEGKLTTKGLLNYIKGPDFPTGGVIINSEDLPEIYENGKGTIKLRSKFRVETINNKPTIIITEVPYLISIEDKIIGKIKEMVVEEDYKLIENVTNHTGNAGFELRITCTRDANVNKVIKDLCERTGFQTSINVNNTSLVNGVPKSLSFVQMVGEYVSYRDRVLKRIALFNLEKAKNRINIIDGLLIAIADIDNVIQIIKSSANKEQARQKLIIKYNFNLEQVNAILDMKLSRLTNLELNDLQSEKGELIVYAEQQESIVNNKNKARDILLIEQILSIKNKYGDDRRTQLSVIKEIENNAEKEELIYLVLNNNSLLPLKKEDKITLNKKGNIITKQGINFGFLGNNIGKTYLFNKNGKINVINNNEFDINCENPLSIDGNLVCALKELNKQFLITVTKKGIIKKSQISEYVKINKTTIAAKIREEDELLYVGCAFDTDFVLILGSKGGLVKIPVKDITTTGKNTIGSKGIDDIAISATIANEEDYILTYADMKAKFTICKEFNITAKGAKGQIITEHTTNIYTINKDFYIIEKNNKLTKMNNKSLAIKSKTASGAKITEEQVLKVIC